MGVHTKSILIQLEGKDIMIYDPANVTRRLATISDESLRTLYTGLNNTTVRTTEQESFFGKVRMEMENRIEHEAKFEFGESNAKDIIDFLVINAERKTDKPRLRIQWNVALDVLMERYPKLANRAEDFVKKNPHLDWHRTFYRLVTDDMANKKAGK